MAFHIAENLWQALHQNSDRKALLMLKAIRADHTLIEEVLLQEVNKIVFGKNEQHLRDSLTCFHLAAKRGMQNVIQEMFNSCERLNLDMPTSLLRWTPLHYAVNGGHWPVVRILVKIGANINVSAGDGRRPLHLAVLRGFQKIVGYLVVKDCNVNVQDEHGNTALHYCLTENILKLTGWSSVQCHEVIELLLIKGACAALKNSTGDCPLHWAVQYNVHLDTVIMIIHSVEQINEGIDILNARNQSSLHLVRNTQVAEALLVCGASVDLTDSGLRTSLHVHVNNFDMVQLLLRHGSQPNVMDNTGKTPLHLAVMSEVPNLWTIEVLSCHDESLNAMDSNFESPLHLACHNNYTRIMVIRNNKQVEVDIQPTEDPVIEILLKHGAKTAVQNKNKQTPLFKALERQLDHKATILYKATEDAGCDQPDQYGRTAKTLYPKWYSVQHMLQKDKNTVIGLRTVKEEDKTTDVTSSSMVVSNDSSSSLNCFTPLPNWVRNESQCPQKQPRIFINSYKPQRAPCRLPRWVFEDTDMTLEDSSSALLPWDVMEETKILRSVPVTTRPVQSLNQQVSTLKNNVEEFKDFLEEFVSEGEKEADEVDAEMAELRGELSSMKIFLEKFSSESEKDAVP